MNIFIILLQLANCSHLKVSFEYTLRTETVFQSFLVCKCLIEAEVMGSEIFTHVEKLFLFCFYLFLVPSFPLNLK
jgi:hypothetical protein